MAHDLLPDFPIIISEAVAWGEMDSLGHVNNTAYFRWFESARIAYLDAIGFLTVQPLGPILASTHCRFRAPLAFPDTVHIGARATDVVDDRFTMEYRVVSDRFQKIAAEGGGVVVCYDYAAARKALLPTPVRERITALEQSRHATQ